MQVPLDSRILGRDLVKEELLPTTMHGSRKCVVIACSRQDPFSTISDSDQGLVDRLLENVLNYMRRLAN